MLSIVAVFVVWLVAAALRVEQSARRPRYRSLGFDVLESR